MPQWTPLGQGTYNYAYVNSSKTEVLKIQKQPSATDTPERSVRLWNQINAHVRPPARLQEYKGRLGWVCPFVQGRQANDKEMRKALIDIFNLSGRIIVDAMAPQNFVTTKSGQVVCIDIGMALQLEKRENDFFSKKNNRRKSITSLEAWADLVWDFQPFFKKNERLYPQTVRTVKALLFIKNNRPDIFNVDFLKRNLQLTKKLAKAYDVQHNRGIPMSRVIRDAITHLDSAEKVASTHPEVKKGTEILSEKRPITIENLKESCKTELTKYIKSRGSLDISGVFSPGLLTRIFRNQKLTKFKVEHAKSLIESIEKASSISEMRYSINQILEVPGLQQATFGSGIMKSIGMCQRFILNAVRLNPELENNNSYSPM